MTVRFSKYIFCSIYIFFNKVFTTVQHYLFCNIPFFIDYILSFVTLEQFSNECRKTENKVITDQSQRRKTSHE